MRYHVSRYHPKYDDGICSVDLDDPCIEDGCEDHHRYVFTVDDLGRVGHHADVWVARDGRDIGWGRDGSYATHVAIPVEQYVRIFGEL